MNLYTPFCVNFIRSFKDANFVYFLMEYINGIALFDAIRVIGLLNS
jgi:cGMP-dependent protein kinase